MSPISVVFIGEADVLTIRFKNAMIADRATFDIMARAA
jgi:hypothetical protein